MFEAQHCRTLVSITGLGLHAGIPPRRHAPRDDVTSCRPASGEIMRALTIALSLGLLTVAGSLGAQAAGTSAARRDSVYVEVNNERDARVTVYLRTGNFDRRLAVVPARETRMIPVPEWAVSGRSNVRLVLTPEGDVDIGMRTFVVQSGNRMSVTVPAHGTLPPEPGDTMMAALTPEELEETTITVENPRNRAVTVFAEQGQYDVRLGRVPARERGTLRFPKYVVDRDRSVRIFVSPDGGTDMSTSLMRLKKGEHLALKVPQY
jgi:hypothetical protein